MNTKSIKKISSAILVTLVGVLIFGGKSAHAQGATIQWNGADCVTNSTECNWSDSNNWVGGVAPGNGDNILFDNSAFTQDEYTVDDIPSTTVFGNVTFQGSSQYSAIVVPYDTSNSTAIVFTMNGDLTDNIVSGSNPSTSGIDGYFANNSANPTYTISDGFQFGFGPYTITENPSDTLSATASFSNGTATFVGSGSNTDIINYAQLVGSKEIDLNLTSDGDLQQLATSTSYTGLIKIISGTLDLAPYLAPATLPDMLSGSQIDVESGSSLVFQDPSATSTTIAEPITLSGNGTADCTNSGNTSNCGSIYADIDPNAVLTFSGDVTLLGDTQLNTSGQITLSGNLSGAYSIATPYIGTVNVAASTNTSNTPNGTYASPTQSGGSGGSGGTGGGSSGGSTSGTGSSSGASDPKPAGTPDTGAALITSNPFITLISTIGSSLVILLISIKIKRYAKH